MAVLNIRNLPDEVHTKLRIRAAVVGRSMEAEARTIITEAVMEDKRELSPTELQAWVDDLYHNQKPQNVVETLIRERRKAAIQE